MPGQVSIIVGLPGSGKTCEFNALKRTASGLCEDDFLLEVLDNAGVLREVRFNDSIHYKKLVTDLKKGKHCVISDIIFCDTWIRHEVEVILTADVPDLSIEWIFFENAPRKCSANAKRRGREETLKRELKLIRYLSKKYVIPRGVKPLKVWTPPKTSILSE